MKELSSRKDGVSTFLDRVQFEGENYSHAVNYLGNLEKQSHIYTSYDGPLGKPKKAASFKTAFVIYIKVPRAGRGVRCLCHSSVWELIYKYQSQGKKVNPSSFGATCFCYFVFSFFFLRHIITVSQLQSQPSPGLRSLEWWDLRHVSQDSAAYLIPSCQCRRLINIEFPKKTLLPFCLEVNCCILMPRQKPSYEKSLAVSRRDLLRPQKEVRTWVQSRQLWNKCLLKLNCCTYSWRQIGPTGTRARDCLLLLFALGGSSGKDCLLGFITC